MEHRLTTAAFLFPNSISVYINTILVVHVHWAWFVGIFLCIVSHLAPHLVWLVFAHIWAFCAIYWTKVDIVFYIAVVRSFPTFGGVHVLLIIYNIAHINVSR